MSNLVWSPAKGQIQVTCIVYHKSTTLITLECKGRQSDPELVEIRAEILGPN